MREKTLKVPIKVSDCGIYCDPECNLADSEITQRGLYCRLTGTRRPEIPGSLEIFHRYERSHYCISLEKSTLRSGLRALLTKPVPGVHGWKDAGGGEIVKPFSNEWVPELEPFNGTVVTLTLEDDGVWQSKETADWWLEPEWLTPEEDLVK